ncbi:galactose oxidase-like domain-containing protein [Amycolatopsis sp. NPDC051045]|uniref:galactose oxidase-like domain-containing protein n=1 Tax=Amycolatopsis sp. NPDC051045 TaxID=3156922 RepID=UPI0034216CB4
MSTEPVPSDASTSSGERPGTTFARRTALTGVVATGCVGLLSQRAVAAPAPPAGPAPTATLRVQPARLSMTIDATTDTPQRGVPVPLTISTTSARSTDVIVSSRTANTHIGPSRDESGRATSITVRIEPNAEATVWVTPRDAGKPGEPGDLLTVSDGHSSVEVEVWIEPTGGRWEPLARPGNSAKSDLQIVAVHAALMRGPNGPEVVMYSPPRERDTSGKLEVRKDVNPEVREKWIWDVKDFQHTETRTLNLNTVTTADVNSGLGHNIFCGAAAHLPDGRLLAAGGHIHADDKSTASGKSLYLYDPHSPEKWKEIPNSGKVLINPRWYPTVTPLPDGLMLIAGGYWDGLWNKKYFGRFLNSYIIYDPKTVTGKTTTGLVNSKKLTSKSPLAAYPGIFVVPGKNPNDTVIAVVETNRAWLHTYLPGEKLTPVGDGSPRMMTTKGTRSYPWYGSMVLLPLHPGDPVSKILAVGGAKETKTDHTDRDKNGTDPTTATADLLRLDPTKPPSSPEAAKWTQLNALRARFLCDATLMADGTVLISGGASQGWSDHNHTPVNEAVIFDPTTEKFHVAATAATPRRYHSVALLLPDGSVLKAGSTGGFGGPNADAGKKNLWFLTRTDAERYLPSYLWRGPRPVIETVNATATASVGPTLQHGKPFTVNAKGRSLNDRCKLALIRLGATTHGNNMEQRYVWLAVSERVPAGDRWSITATPPASKAAAPPGDYMLVVVDSVGVPSAAQLVRVANTGP